MINNQQLLIAKDIRKRLYKTFSFYLMIISLIIFILLSFTSHLWLTRLFQLIFVVSSLRLYLVYKNSENKLRYSDKEIEIEYSNKSITRSNLTKVIVYEDSTDFIFTKGSYSIKNKNWNNINDMVEYYKKSTVVSLEIKKDKKPNDDWWYIMQLFD